jgi:hypothetical protein
MPLIAISDIRTKEDTPYNLIRRLLELNSREKITSLTVVSAYTDPMWIEKLIQELEKNIKFQCILDYSASGYNRDEKTTEKLNELSENISTKFRTDSGIYLARVGRFLHSKILIATTSEKRHVGAVGSLNFTRRGFLDNEEIMYVVKNPNSVVNYANKILSDSKQLPLNEKFSQRQTATYRDWMLAGCIFFEDKESSPFNFKLGLPDGALTSSSNIHLILESKTSDNVSILKILQIETNGRVPGWKKYCINTCYGHWCPKQLVDEAIKNIDDSVESKLSKVKSILTENGKKNLYNNYMSLFEEIEKNTKELGYEWDKDKAIIRLGAWLNRVIEKLNDVSNQRRLLAGVGGPAVVPDLWAGDELALHEFEESFCSHVVIELAKKRVSNKIAQFLWDSDFDGHDFGSDEWEDFWYDEDKWLEWLHEQRNDPFELVSDKA